MHDDDAEGEKRSELWIPLARSPTGVSMWAIAPCRGPEPPGRSKSRRRRTRHAYIALHPSVALDALSVSDGCQRVCAGANLAETVRAAGRPGRQGRGVGA